MQVYIVGDLTYNGVGSARKVLGGVVSRVKRALPP